MIDFKQYENGALYTDHSNLKSPWINGILNPQHSAYAEGMSRPQRVVFAGLNTNGSGSVTHTFKFYNLATKTQGQVVHHAEDFLTSWKAAQDAATLIGGVLRPTDTTLMVNLFNDQCANAIGPPG